MTLITPAINRFKLTCWDCGTEIDTGIYPLEWDGRDLMVSCHSCEFGYNITFNQGMVTIEPYER